MIRRRPDEAEPNPAGFGSVSFFWRGGTNVTVIRSEPPSLPAHLRFVAIGRQRAGSGRSAVCCMGRRLSCRHRPSCRRSAGIGVGINCGRAYFFISDRVFRRGGVILNSEGGCGGGVWNARSAPQFSFRTDRNTNAYGVEPIIKGRADGSSGSTNDCDLPSTEYSSGYVPDGDRVGDVFRKTQPNE